MHIKKAYKFRLYPNQTQQQTLQKQFGIVRFVYNYFLHLRNEQYRNTGKGLNYYDLANQLVVMKKEEAYEWLREGDSQTMQQSLKDQERAFQNFFEKRSGYPKYKSKRSNQTIRYPQRVKINPENKRTYLPKIGWVKTKFHQEIEGKIKNVTVSKTKSGKYYASFQVEMEIVEPEVKGKTNGVDLGIHDFAVLSNGRKYTNPHHLKQAERQLRKNQRVLSRRKKGSHRWEKQKHKVAVIHEKVYNARRDFQHKLSRQLVEEHGCLVLENLNVRGMVKNHRLAKHISDAGWSEFISLLEYKGRWYGCQVKKIDRWYPSSKTCSVCGSIIEELPLHIRQWICPECGEEHDRDINAAKNILKQTTVGTTESHASGVHVRPDCSMEKQAGMLKLETSLFATR